MIMTPVDKGLLIELAKEEDHLIEVGQQLAQSRANFDVASNKYAAIRDMIARRLRQSPYSNDVNWPGEAHNIVKPSRRGRYRFLLMKPGDAIVQVLKENENPQSLDEIVAILSDGGARTAGPRTVNAALMRTTGVIKTDDGKYRYEEPQSEDDELPI